MYSSRTIGSNCDILWIETRVPVIAIIYYKLHLQKTHTLYCPDDITTSTDHTNAAPVKPRHVRDLARDILHVIDSNNYKKLALHFIKPVGTTKTEDLVRFLLKRRSRLTLSHLTLPCPSIQHYYLSGWSYSLDEAGLDPIWPRQCRVKPKQLIESPSTLIPATNTYTEMEFSQPFAVASQEFKKKALFVHVTQEMLLLHPNMVSALATDATENIIFQLNETTLLAIQGWMDAVSAVASENGNTLILIADEKSLLSASDVLKLQSLNPEEMDRTLASWRKELWKIMESMATIMPIYFLLNRFTGSTSQTTLSDNLAWLQHRHHICIPHSVLLTWRPYSATDDHSVFTQLEQVVLTSIAKYDKLRWKTEFMELLQKMDVAAFTDPLIYISPGKLDMNEPLPSTSIRYSTPLVSYNQQPFLPTVYESGPSFTHSISSSSIQVTNPWILNAQQQQQQQQNDNKEDTIENGSNGHETNDLDQQVDSKASDVEEKRALELENLADSLDHDKVRDYISNSGAYSRGEGLLNIWTMAEHSWDDKSNLVVIFGKAKGTSDTPYQVYARLNRVDQAGVIKDGFCSCPVGRAGRCKHVTALLLRFMINVDDFEPAHAEIDMPLMDKDQTAKSPTANAPVKTSPSSKAQQSTPIMLPAQETRANSASTPPAVVSVKTDSNETGYNTTDHCNSSIITPPASSNSDHITKNSTLPPQRRRILPWDINSQKDIPKSKKQRVNKPPKNAPSSMHSPESQPINPPLPTPEKKPTTSKKSRTSTKVKKEPTWMDGSSGSDSMSWDGDEQVHGPPKPARRSTRKRTIQQEEHSKVATSSHNTDDPIMHKDDPDSAILETRPPPPPQKSASQVFDLTMTSDDDDLDDEELPRGNYTLTPHLSAQLPIPSVQKSSLSLPMTNLALLGENPGSETEDEDLPSQPSRQPTLKRDKLDLERSTTSDLFDELGL